MFAVMSCPTESVPYGNNIDDIAGYLDEAHGDRYAIFNIPSKNYAVNKYVVT